MTDHADTIRRFFAMCQPVQYHAGAWGPPTEALDALLAERQQAIDDAAKWKECFESASQALDATAADWNAEQARCEQAIDALREIASVRYIGGRDQTKEIARAALLSLGEQP